MSGAKTFARKGKEGGVAKPSRSKPSAPSPFDFLDGPDDEMAVREPKAVKKDAPAPVKKVQAIPEPRQATASVSGQKRPAAPTKNPPKISKASKPAAKPPPPKKNTAPASAFDFGDDDDDAPVEVPAPNGHKHQKVARSDLEDDAEEEAPKPKAAARGGKGAGGGDGGAFDFEVGESTTLMEAQESGEQLELLDEASFALEGLLREASPPALVRGSATKLVELLSSRPRRRMLRAAGGERSVSVNGVLQAISKYEVEGDPALALALAAILHELTQPDGSLEPLGEQAACGLLARLLRAPPAPADPSALDRSSRQALQRCRAALALPQLGSEPAAQAAARSAADPASPSGARALAAAVVSACAASGETLQAVEASRKFKACFREVGGLPALCEAARGAAGGLDLAEVGSVGLLVPALHALEHLSYLDEASVGVLVDVEFPRGGEAGSSGGGGGSSQGSGSQGSRGSKGAGGKGSKAGKAGEAGGGSAGAGDGPGSLVGVLVGCFDVLRPGGGAVNVDGLGEDERAECLKAALKVLVNLTHAHARACRQLAVAGGLPPLCGLLGHYCPPPSAPGAPPGPGAGRPGSLPPSLQEEGALDVLNTVLCLAVNVVEKDAGNCKAMAGAETGAGPGARGGTHGVVALLCALVCSVHGEGEGDGAGEDSGDEVTEDDFHDRERAGEAAIVKAYAACLLGFLVRADPGRRGEAARRLPGGSLAPLVHVLERFCAFHTHTRTMTVEQSTALEKLIRDLQGPGSTPIPGG